MYNLGLNRKLWRTLLYPQSNKRNRKCDDPPERSGWRIWMVLCLPTFYCVHMWLRDDYAKYTSIDGTVLEESFDGNGTSWIVAGYVTVARSKNDAKIKNLTGLRDWLMDSLGVRADRNKTTKPRKHESLPICEMNRTMLKLDTKVHHDLIISKDNVKYKKLYPDLKIGGYFVPDGCTARHQIAIIVPYRGREENLKIFLYNIHPFLMAQKLEYQIFIVEQYGNESFNKGRLYNTGYKEIQEFGKWKCIVFHDVDLLPTDRRILYTCPMYPRHMCAGLLNDPKYHKLFGGVVAMTPKHYEKANGYSNLFWNWEGEDNDMFWRIRFTGTPVVRYDKRIAKYLSLPHTPQHRNPPRYDFQKTVRDRRKHEGLSSIQYRLISTTLRHLFTHILVDINPYGDNTTLG